MSQTSGWKHRIGSINTNFGIWNTYLQQLPATVEESQDQYLQEQVETLSASLITITEEKSKLETSYIADKKAIKVGTIYTLPHLLSRT